MIMLPVLNKKANKLNRYMRLLGVTVFILFTNACTTVTIDEHRSSSKRVEISEGQSVVVLGRRQSSDYETEPTLVSCVGNVLASGTDGLKVIPEPEFLNSLYPWFEPRTAPMRVSDLERFLTHTEISSVMDQYGIRYIIWIDGNTVKTDSAGSIGCSISVGGAGCFGFGTWENQSDYEAVVWDYNELETHGQISAGASGTSYMPAVVIPIPIIARVKNSACKGMGEQLKSYFSSHPQ